MENSDFVVYALTVVLGILTIINFVSGQKDKANKNGKESGDVTSTLISIRDQLVDLKSDLNEIKINQNKQGLDVATLKESARQFEAWKKEAEKRIHVIEITIAGGENNE